MIETINGKAYLKVGDKVYELGGGPNIITADSVEQLPDPASVPEGTIAFVKSEGGGSGLTVIEITTDLSAAFLGGESIILSAEEGAQMDKAAAVGGVVHIVYMGVEFPTVFTGYVLAMPGGYAIPAAYGTTAWLLLGKEGDTYAAGFLASQ